MREANVYIWLPGKYYVPGIGHASLELKTTARTDYITWSAQGHPLARPVPSLAGPHYREIGKGFDFKKDQEGMVDFFGQDKPHYTIPLPTLHMSAEGLCYGLDVARTQKFWQARLANPPQYAFLSKKMNCTGCVAEALVAGGLSYYARKPVNLFVQDARTLLTWVQMAEREIRRQNDRRRLIEEKMREVESDAKRQALSVEVKKDAKMDTLPGPAEIPSLAEWKKDSDEKVSFRKFAGRIEQVAALDRLIERYHRRPINPVTQYALLIRMQDEIYSHLTLKPQSDRHRAVIKLGATVTIVLKRLTRTHEIQRLYDSKVSPYPQGEDDIPQGEDDIATSEEHRLIIESSSSDSE